MENSTNEIFITLPDFYWFSLKAIGQEYGREMKAVLSQPIPEFNYEPTDFDKLDYQLEDLTNSMVSSEFNMYMLHHTFSESDAFEDYMNEALGLTSTQALDLLLAVALQDNVDQIKINSNKLIINLNAWARLVLEDILADSSYWEKRAVPHSIEQYFKLLEDVH